MESSSANTPAAPRPAAKTADSGSGLKRLQSELMQLMQSATPGVSAFPKNGNLFNWTGTIIGPEGTYYEGYTFKLSFEFPTNYPMVPPTVLFLTPMFHPNVDMAGRICLDILKDTWSAVYNIQTILLSLQSLLGEPNNKSPLNGQAAELWDSEPEQYRKLVAARYKDVDEE